MVVSATKLAGLDAAAAPWDPERVRRAIAWRLRRARQAVRGGRLPDFLLIGERSAGTTSLYAYLTQHPQVMAATRKELDFFNEQFREGMLWYRMHFPTAAEATRRSREIGKRIVTGEATPEYLFHPLCARRIRAKLPNVRVIALLRDPVARAFSHYHHELAAGRETLSFEEALAHERERLWGQALHLLASDGGRNPNYRRYSYLARGAYAEHLRAYFALFDPAQILVVRSEDMFASPQQTVDEVSDFLGLDRAALPDPAPRNKGKYGQAAIPNEAALRDHFRPFNERLYELLGRDMGW
jgi:hypothetical protein